MDEIESCFAIKGNLICLKPKHKGRHLFRPRPHVAPERPWNPIENIDLPTGLVRRPTETLSIGDIVGVAGKQGEWRIIRIEQHAETQEINVDVVSRRTGHSHTYRVENIQYRRRSKVNNVH